MNIPGKDPRPPKAEAPSKGGAVETVDLYAGSEGGYADFSNYPLDKAGGAIFTTKSPQLAAQYGTPRKVQVTGRILDGDTPEAGQLAREFWSERGAPEGISLREWPNAIYNEPAVNAEFRDFLTGKGYAAYIKPPKRQGEGKHSYVVLDPKAIKYTE